ncbi:MAG: hypothetical protein ALECFALPRED_003622 [Alectoria fallacina]|uniref:Uncharacterized protein n=1 Tax=Alectoria fallacina TaxID=1903189 RepID=A0A8H3FM80_9LECA|nr:MAG: hypothetical protein ALECFALPRED_003622 [Alectoria fallacina]
MAEPQTSPVQPLPPLLALPLELKEQIFAELSSHEGGELSLTILRRTHPVFRYLVPRKPLALVTPYQPGDTPSKREYNRTLDIRRERLLFAELNHPYLFPPDLYPCYTCGEVLGGSHFEPYTSRYFRSGCLDTRHMPLGTSAAHGTGSSNERKCESCHESFEYYIWSDICGQSGDRCRVGRESDGLV